MGVSGFCMQPFSTSLLLSARVPAAAAGWETELEDGEGSEIDLGSMFLLQASPLAPQTWAEGDSCSQAQDCPV